MFKTILKSIVIASVIVAPFSAFAAQTLPGTNSSQGCTVPPDHGIWSADGTTLVGCITAEAWNTALDAQAHGDNVRIFFWPATVTDKYGLTYDCGTSVYHFFNGCVDPTSGPGYDTYIRGLGKQLVANGYHAGAFGGRFDGLMAAVR